MGNINTALFSKKIQDFNEQGFKVDTLRAALDNPELSNDEIKTVFDDFEYKADMITSFKVRLYHLKNPSNEFMVSAIESKMGSVDNFEHIIDSISRLEEGIDPDDPENIRSVYIKKTLGFKNQNYHISELEKLKNLDIVKFVSRVDEFSRGIKIIDDLRKRIEELTYAALKDEVRELMSDMRDPLLARKCLEKVIYLETLVADSKSFFETRLSDFKERGYDTKDLDGLLELDFDPAYAKFSEFDKKIRKYEKIKENLETISCPDTEDDVEKLTQLIGDINNLEEIDKIYSKVHKHISTLKTKGLKLCSAWEDAGFDISPFEEINSLDFTSFDKKIESFAKNVQEIELLTTRFAQLENPWFADECKAIQNLLKQPDRIDELKEKFKAFEHLLEDSVREYQGEAMNWKTQGFDISELEDLDDLSDIEKLKIYHKYEEDLDLIPDLRRKIDDIDNSIYGEKIKEIEEKLKNPSFVHEAFRIIESLEESSVDKREKIKEEFEKYTKEEYKTDTIEPYLEARLDVLIEKWNVFSSNIQVLKDVKERLQAYGPTPFDEDLEEVKFNLKDPSRAAQVKKAFEGFHKKCEAFKDVFTEKLSDYKKMGFEVDTVSKALDSDLLNMEKTFADFESNVSQSLELSEKLEKLDTSIFTSEAESLKEELKEVNAIEKTRKKFEKLSEIIEENHQALKDRIQGFSKRGYNISMLLRHVDKPQKELLETIRRFEDSIEIVIRLKGEFEDIDRDYFSAESLEIEALLLRPFEHETTKKKIRKLREKVENHRKNIRKKIDNLESEGYDISQIRPFLHSRLTVFSNQSDIFFDEISSLKKIESSLFSIDSSIFPKHKKEILRLLKIPGCQDQAVNEIEILKKRIKSAREYYKSQIDFYKQSGFRVDSLEKSMSKSLMSVKETFSTFETRLPELISLRAEFYMIDHNEFPEIAEQIRNLYTDPMSLNMLKDSMRNLKARIENSKSLYVEYIEKMKTQGYTTSYLEKGISKPGSIRKIIKQEYQDKLKKLEELKIRIFDLDSTYDYERFSRLMEQTMDVDSIEKLEESIKVYSSEVEEIKSSFNEKISEFWDIGFDITDFALKSSDATIEKLNELFNDFTKTANLMMEKIEEIKSMDFSAMPEKRKELIKKCGDIKNYEEICKSIKECCIEIKKSREKIEYRIKNIESQGWKTDFFLNFEKMNIADSLSLLSLYEEHLRKSAALVSRIKSMDFSLFPNVRTELLEKVKSPEFISSLKEDIEYYTKVIQGEEKHIKTRISQITDFKTDTLSKQLEKCDLKSKGELIEEFFLKAQKCRELENMIRSSLTKEFTEQSRDILGLLTDPMKYDAALILYEERKKAYTAQHSKLTADLNDLIEMGWIFEIQKDFAICSVSHLKKMLADIQEKISFSKSLNDRLVNTDFSLHSGYKSILKEDLKKVDFLEKVQRELKRIEESNNKIKENIDKEISAIRSRYADVDAFVRRIEPLCLKEKVDSLETIKGTIGVLETLLKKIYSLDLSIFDEAIQRINKLAENPENIEIIQGEYNNIIKKIQAREQNYSQMIKRWKNDGYDVTSLLLSEKSSLKLKEDLLFDYEMLIPKLKLQIQRLDSIDTSIYQEEANAVRESLKNPFRLQECQLRIDALESSETKLREWLQVKIKSYEESGFNISSLEKNLRLSLAKVIKTFDQFEKDIQRLEEINQTYFSDDFYFFNNEMKEISKLMKDPVKADLLEKKMEALSKKCTEKRGVLLKKIQAVLDSDAVISSAAESITDSANVNSGSETVVSENEETENSQNEIFEISFYEKKSLKDLNKTFLHMEQRKKELKELVKKIEKEDFSLYQDELEALQGLCSSRFNLEKISDRYELLKKERARMADKFESQIAEYEHKGYGVDDVKRVYKSSIQSKFVEYFNDFKNKTNECESLRHEVEEKFRYQAFDADRKRLIELTYDVKKINDIRKTIKDFERKFEKNVSFYKRKAEALKKTGYNVELLERIVEEGDFDKIEELFKKCDENICYLENLKYEIEPLRCIYFADDFREIQLLMNNPFELEKVLKLRDALKKKKDETLKVFLENIYNIVKQGFHFSWLGDISSMGLDELNTRYMSAVEALKKRTSIIKSYRLIKSDLSVNEQKNIENVIESRSLGSSLEDSVETAGRIILEERERYFQKIIAVREKGYAFEFNVDESEFLSLQELKQIFEKLEENIKKIESLSDKKEEIDFSVQRMMKDNIELALLDLRDTSRAEELITQAIEYQKEFIASMEEQLQEFTEMGYDVSDYYAASNETLAEKMQKVKSIQGNIRSLEQIDQRLESMVAPKFEMDIQVIRGFIKKPLFIDRVKTMTDDLEKRIENEIVKIKSRIRDYEFQGYKIETIIKFENSSYQVLKENFDEFKNRISWLEKLKERIENIDEGIFDEKLSPLRKMLHDVTKIEEIEQGIGQYMELLENKRSEARAKISIFTKKDYNIEQLLKTIDTRVGSFESDFEDYLKLVKKADLLIDRLDRMDLEIFEDKKNDARKKICEIYNFEEASKHLYELEYFLEAYVEGIVKEVEAFRAKGYVKPDYIKCVYKKNVTIKEKKQALERYKSQINILISLLTTLEGMDTSLFTDQVNEIFPLFMDCTKIEYLNTKLDELSLEITSAKDDLKRRVQKYRLQDKTSSYFEKFDKCTLMEIQDAFDLYDSLENVIEDKKARLEIYTSYEEEKQQALDLVKQLDTIENIEKTLKKIEDFENSAKGYYAMAIKRYKEKGYSTARLDAALPQTPDIVQSVFKSYEADLSILEDAVSYMENIDDSLYMKERQELKKISKNPSGASKAARIVKEVREKEDKRRQSLIDRIENYRDQGFDVAMLDKIRGESISKLNEALEDFSAKADLLIEYRLYFDKCMKLVDFTSEYTFTDVDLISFGYIKVQLSNLESTYYNMKKFNYTESEIQKIKTEVTQKITENMKKLDNRGYNISMFENLENLAFSRLINEYIDFLKDLVRLSELDKRLSDFSELKNDPDYIMAKAEVLNTVAIEFIEEKIAVLAEKTGTPSVGTKISEKPVEDSDSQENFKSQDYNAGDEKNEVAEETSEDKINAIRETEKTPSSTTEKEVSKAEDSSNVSEKDTSEKANDKNDEKALNSQSTEQVEKAVEKEIAEKAEELDQTETETKPKAPAMTDEMKRKFEEWKKREQNE